MRGKWDTFRTVRLEKFGGGGGGGGDSANPNGIVAAMLSGGVGGVGVTFNRVLENGRIAFNATFPLIMGDFFEPLEQSRTNGSRADVGVCVISQPIHVIGPCLNPYHVPIKSRKKNASPRGKKKMWS